MLKINFNNKIILSDTPCISHNDCGFTLGHGIFETILVKKNTFPALSYHWQRLKTSAPIIDIAIPFSYQELETMLSELIIENNLQDKIAGARLTITHGRVDRGLIPIHIPKPNFLISVFECAKTINRPLSVLIAKTKKNEHTAAAKIKSLSYLDNILAKQEAINKKYDEALLLNTASNVADCSVCNIFMIKNQHIFTPPIADGALPGVIRRILLTECNCLFPIIEKSISCEEILTADEAFLTNALMGVKFIGKINETEFHSFEVAKKIRDLLIQKKNYI